MAGKRKRASMAEEGDKDDREGRQKPQMWTDDEEAAVFKAVWKLALANVKTILHEPGLEQRDSARVNMKIKQLAKASDKSRGGDGKWVDDFIKRKGDK